MNVKAKIRQVNEKENQRCFNCHSLGHFSTECPEPQMTLCYNCREQGHKTFECPRTVSCRNCGQVGHKERQCRAKKLNSGTDSIVTTSGHHDRWGSIVDLDGSSPNSLERAASDTASAMLKLQLSTPGRETSNMIPAPPPPPPPPPGIPSLTQNWMIDSIANAPEKLSPMSSKSNSQNLGQPVSDTPSPPTLDDSTILQGLLSAYLSVASTPTHTANAPAVYPLQHQASTDLNSDSSDYQNPQRSEKSLLSPKPRYARSETAAEVMPDSINDAALFHQMRWRSSSAIRDVPASSKHMDQQITMDSDMYPLDIETANRRKSRSRGATEASRRPASFQDGSTTDGRRLPTSSPYRTSTRRSTSEAKSPCCLATSTLATIGSRSTMAATPADASRSSFRHSTSNSRHISWNKSVHQSASKETNTVPTIGLLSSQLEAARLVSSLPALPSRPDDTFSSMYASRAPSSLIDDLEMELPALSTSCQSGRQNSFCLELNSSRVYSQSLPVAPVAPQFNPVPTSPSIMTIALGQDPYLIAYSEPVTTDYSEGQYDIPNELASKYMAPCSVVGRPMWLLNAAALFRSDDDPFLSPSKLSRGGPNNMAQPPHQQNSWQGDMYASQPPVVVAVQAPREEESPNLTDDLCTQDMPLSCPELEVSPTTSLSVAKSNSRLRLPASPSSFSVASAPTSHRYHGSLSPSPAMRPSASSATSWLSPSGHLS